MLKLKFTDLLSTFDSIITDYEYPLFAFYFLAKHSQVLEINLGRLKHLMAFHCIFVSCNKIKRFNSNMIIKSMYRFCEYNKYLIFKYRGALSVIRRASQASYHHNNDTVIFTYYMRNIYVICT